MPNQAVASITNLTDTPESVGPALAQVVHIDAERDVILGQAWLAAPNQLVTCGHVVDPFVEDPSGLFAYFPSSGRRYPVRQIRLHPSFVRQADGLVKFDAALMIVDMTGADAMIPPLPFCYEHVLSVNESLWTIRYPAHLGQFSATPQPLSQEGRFLGNLGKHDHFHLLHDVPLSPGDSGAPITDGQAVVAMHCGDTATIPGLNLPTTSIRLALWVDALRDLRLQPTTERRTARRFNILPALCAFFLTAALAYGTMISAGHPKRQTPALAPAEQVLPLRVSFNEPLDGYSVGDPVEVTLTASSDCYPFLFLIDDSDRVVKLSPVTAFAPLKAGHYKLIDQFKMPEDEHATLQASSQPLTLLAVVVDADDDQASAWAQSFMNDKVWPASDRPTLNIDAKTLLAKVVDFQTLKPSLIYFHKFQVRAAKKSAASG